jgi:hypothetical protein
MHAKSTPQRTRGLHAVTGWERHVPRADAKWIGSLLAQLSPEQIGDAFRAGGYSPEEAKAFTEVLISRIHEFNEL